MKKHVLLMLILLFSIGAYAQKKVVNLSKIPVTPARSQYNKGYNIYLKPIYYYWSRDHYDDKSEILLFNTTEENIEVMLDELIRILDFYSLKAGNAIIDSHTLPKDRANFKDPASIMSLFKEKNNSYEVILRWAPDLLIKDAIMFAMNKDFIMIKISVP